MHLLFTWLLVEARVMEIQHQHLGSEQLRRWPGTPTSTPPCSTWWSPNCDHERNWSSAALLTFLGSMSFLLLPESLLLFDFSFHLHSKNKQSFGLFPLERIPAWETEILGPGPNSAI